MNKPMLSFVIPCYRSEHTIGAVVKELTDTLSTRSEYEYEIVLVNDGSPDNTAGALEALSREVPRVVFVDLSRNFGQHSALMAGFHQVKGDIVICLDDDGQTPGLRMLQADRQGGGRLRHRICRVPGAPPELVPQSGQPVQRRLQPFLLRSAPGAEGQQLLCLPPLCGGCGAAIPQSVPVCDGLLFQSVSRYCNVPVNHRARMEGRSGYSLKKLVSLWFNGVTSFSIKPLRFATYFGFFVAAFGFIFALVTIIRKLVNPAMQAGWASTISLILFMGGVIVLLIGLVGEYIGRIYLSINRYPQFVVRRVMHGGEEAKHEDDARSLGA